MWIENGSIPYRDVWEAKPPLALLFNGLAGVLGETTPLGLAGGVRAFSAVSAALAGLALAAVLRAYRVHSGLAVAGALVWTAILTSPMHANGGGLTEVPAFATGTIAWALVAYFRARKIMIAAGALSCTALLIHPQSLPLVAMVVVTALISDEGAVQRGRWIGWGLVGAALVAVPVIIYFAAHGAFDEMVATIVGYNGAFAAVSCPVAGTNGWPCFDDVDFSSSLLWHALIMLPALPAALALATGRGLRRTWPLLVFVVLMVLLALPMVRRSPTTHYMWPLLFAALVVVIAGADELRRRLHEGPHPRLRLLMACLLLTTIVAASTMTFVSVTRLPGALDAADAVALEQADALEDDQPLFVWGTTSSLYQVSRRQPAGEFVHLFGLMLPGYTDAELVQRACLVLARERPLIIDDGTGPGLALGSTTANGMDPEWFAPLRNMVASEWEVVAEFGGTRILQPRSNDPLPVSVCR